LMATIATSATSLSGRMIDILPRAGSSAGSTVIVFQEGMPEDERDPEPLRSVFNSLLRFGCRKLPHQLNFRLYSLPFWDLWHFSRSPELSPVPTRAALKGASTQAQRSRIAPRRGQL
jgi:hypothetical protein